uniref:non-specific serine/threonine protein kinase n=1 Tax=Culex tarsalis TaxID=7177 RepID=A0A1Q3G0M5_CULTA
MGKRHIAVDHGGGDHCETPQKRQKVASAAAASPFVEMSPMSSSPALNMSFTLTREFVDGTILTDLALKDWRIGKPIGKGSFGEIFLASDNVFRPVTSENAKYVVKIEPHSNGPLFVEIHALLNTAKRTESNVIPAGMPEYIASGSHYFKNERYRFLILKRYQRDLHSLIKNRRVDPASVPIIALQILDVLEHLHDKGYVHSDIKGENLMIGKVPASALLDLKSSKCFQEEEPAATTPKQKKHKLPTVNGHNGLTSTPTVLTKKSTTISEFGGANPVRSCRNGTDEFVTSGTYKDMVKSHYLRPLKNIVYRDDSDEEDGKNGKKKRKKRKDGDTSKSFFYTITTKNVGEHFKQIDVQVSRNGASLVASGAAETPKSAAAAAKNGVPEVMEERIHLIDFGLASKFVDSTGQHRPFCMDQRRAHDGTLEFTSRDAHMGAHARRSDLECLGYNLIYWSRGFLPWKDEKMLNQPEQVHRMKEYFMTDVREMLKLIYGEDCPKYLGEFLHYVGGLNYDDRPDYDFLRSLFCQELRRLGQKPCGPYLKLNVHNIVKLSEPLTAQDEAEITNKINHVKSLMKMGVLPYRESTLHNKTTSPKNLRSKRDSTRTPGNNGATRNGTTSTAKKEKPFSWSEILSTDPDQIARERAEKEFERADLVEEVVIRYTGNPTYAIRELENKRESGVGGGGGLEYTESEGYIRGYTKPMMDILRKRQSQLIRDVCQERRNCSNGVKEPPDEAKAEAGEDELEREQEEEEVEEVGSENESVCSDVASEADSGNDDVDGEEEQEEEVEEDDADSDHSEVVRRKGKGRRRVLHSESSDQQDSDFNDQDSSEHDSRDSRKKKSRGRPRLNREQPKSRLKQQSSTDSKTKVPVIASNNNNNNNKPYYGDVDDSSHDVPSSARQKFLLLKRRKSGLRERIRPTDRSAKYRDDLALKKSKRSPRKRYSDDEDYRVDDSSCSSSQSSGSIASTMSTASSNSSANSNFSDYRGSAGPVRKSSRKRTKRSFSSSSRSVTSQSSRSSSAHGTGTQVNGHSETATAAAPAATTQRPSAFVADEEDFFDDDDTRDMDYSPCKTKRGRKVGAGVTGRRNGASIKKRLAEVKGPAATVAKGNNVAGGGVVAGLRGRRGDHQVRTYSRG